MLVLAPFMLQGLLASRTARQIEPAQHPPHLTGLAGIHQLLIDTHAH
ncbi:hypothetical protein ACFVRB_33070 [Streptomyces nojiriensis]